MPFNDSDPVLVTVAKDTTTPLSWTSTDWEGTHVLQDNVSTSAWELVLGKSIEKKDIGALVEGLHRRLQGHDFTPTMDRDSVTIDRLQDWIKEMPPEERELQAQALAIILTNWQYYSREF